MQLVLGDGIKKRYMPVTKKNDDNNNKTLMGFQTLIKVGCLPCLHHEQIKIWWVWEHAHAFAFKLMLEFSSSSQQVISNNPFICTNRQYNLLLLQSSNPHDCRRMLVSVYSLRFPWTVLLIPKYHCMITPPSCKACISPGHETYTIYNTLKMRLFLYKRDLFLFIWNHRKRDYVKTIPKKIIFWCTRLLEEPALKKKIHLGK